LPNPSLPQSLLFWKKRSPSCSAKSTTPTSIPKGTTTPLSSASRTPKSSPSPSSSSYERRTPRGAFLREVVRSFAFSPISSRGWWTFIHLRSMAAFASSGATWTLWGEPSRPSWWEIPKDHDRRLDAAFSVLHPRQVSLKARVSMGPLG
jgi:hypothetical protein